MSDCNKLDILKVEKLLNLRRSTVFILLVIVLFFFNVVEPLQKKERIVVLTIFLIIYLLYLLVTVKMNDKGKFRSIWWIGFLLDASLISVLISFNGQIMSPYVLLYPVAMIGAAPSCPRVSDFVIAGFVGHVSYALGIFAFMGNLSFYLDFQFWTVGIISGIVFLCTVQLVQSLIKRQAELLTLTRKLEEKNKKLETAAITDGLTGLYNHKAFWERLEQEYESAKRKKYKLTVIMIDTDFFKLYNDTMGHLKGDELLVQLSKLMKENVRIGDIVFRYGGDEFAIILPETNIKEGIHIAERLRDKVASFSFEKRDLMPESKVTISIGIACYPDDADNIKDLVNRADNALYAAKNSNKNQVQAYRSLLKEMQNKGSSNEDILKTMEVMISIINSKDRYTAGHCERVANYARAIGEKLSFDEERLGILTYAALLHDIGKIEIDKKILNKLGPLDKDEWADIKGHPIYGIKILEAILASKKLLPAIKHHHERYDGKGYPDGLPGEKIPLEARILALADSFDAMLSDRPYRLSLGIEKALKELQENAGQQFDPELVAVFLEILEEARVAV
ncbi:MAG: diguanylate cyclase [Clostridia bacterium]|jgi:diguanylate cyclase (GGDEF)-like protein/putative nucleotidyltransferase with HDIG domain|nr:diguanylate cyclase [Clostridia bacterium]